MKLVHYFLAAVSFAAQAPDATAQAPALPPVPQSCPGGVCPRVQAAVTQVRAAGAGVLHAAGNVVAGAPVRGVYGDGTVCDCPPVHIVPQRMPVREQHRPLHRLHLLFQKLTGRD